MKISTVSMLCWVTSIAAAAGLGASVLDFRGRQEALRRPFDEATVAAREVAEEEKALELEKMQRQLEKEMREADEKLKEKEARVRAPQSCLACTLLDLCRDVCGLRVASVCYDRCAGEPAVQGAAAASE